MQIYKKVKKQNLELEIIKNKISETHTGKKKTKTKNKSKEVSK
jgi:hypothetical protein